MKFGIAFANTGLFADPEPAGELARVAEEAGFESIWTVEHVIWPEQYSSQYPYHPSGKMPGNPSTPIPDPLIWLTWIAANSTRLRLGTGILLLPERNPLIVAKEIATLDRLSGGRMELGIGVGWLEEEFDALGVPFAARGRRTEVYVEALHALWGGDSVSYASEFVSFSGVSSNPKPVQDRVPITIGGHTRVAARRAGRMADGFWPGRGSIDEMGALFDEVRRSAAEHGRDPAAIELSAGHPEGLAEETEKKLTQLADMGVTRAMEPAYQLMRPNPTDALQHFGSEAIAAYGNDFP